MKRTFREYRAAGRAAVRGSYGKLLLTIVIAAIAPGALIQIMSYFMKMDNIMILVSMLVVEILVNIILMRPLIVGMHKVFLDNARGRTEVSEVLRPFRTNLNNTIKVCFIRDLKLLLWLIIPCLIGYIAYVFIGAEIISRLDPSDEMYTAIQQIALYVNSGAGSITANMIMKILPIILSLFAVMLICCIPAMIKSYEYKMIEFILAENEDISSKEAFRRTKEMMKGNKLRLFGLEMTYIGWIVLGLLTFSIAIIFVLPFIQAAVTQFYLDVNGQNKEKEIINYESDQEA